MTAPSAPCPPMAPHRTPFASRPAAAVVLCTLPSPRLALELPIQAQTLINANPCRMWSTWRAMALSSPRPGSAARRWQCCSAPRRHSPTTASRSSCEPCVACWEGLGGVGACHARWAARACYACGCGLARFVPAGAALHRALTCKRPQRQRMNIQILFYTPTAGPLGTPADKTTPLTT